LNLTSKNFLLAAIFFCAVFSAAAEEPRIADERIVLRTIGGDIVLALFPEVAPRTVEQLLKLARLGVYDSVHFYRLDPGFVLQLTDCNDYNRLTKMSVEQKAAIKKLPAEFSDIKHVRGILSMARRDDLNDAESSFSILLGNAPHLDRQYTVFGKVERGMDVVDYLEKIRRKKNSTVPITRLTIQSAQVVTGKELAVMPLIPQQTILATYSDEDEAVAPEAAGVESLSAPRRVVLCGLAFVVIIGLLGFLVSKRASPRALLLFNLLHLLVASVLLLVMLTAAGRAFANLHQPEGGEGLSQVFDDCNKAAIAGMAGVIVVALLGIVLTRAAPKTVMSLNLINVLIAFFLLFAIIAPITQSSKALACCLFLGALCIFKLMGSFESA
jgi:cyclophilin family peptidyl-prolyl cis-trans isomerase